MFRIDGLAHALMLMASNTNLLFSLANTIESSTILVFILPNFLSWVACSTYFPLSCLELMELWCLSRRCKLFAR